MAARVLYSNVDYMKFIPSYDDSPPSAQKDEDAESDDPTEDNADINDSCGTDTELINDFNWK